MTNREIIERLKFITDTAESAINELLVAYVDNGSYEGDSWIDSGVIRTAIDKRNEIAREINILLQKGWIEYFNSLEKKSNDQ